jgi:hypothetical protein
MRQRQLRSSLRGVAIFSLMLGASGAALSADLGAVTRPGAPPSQWRLSFTPYAWLTWLDGEQTVRGRSVDVHVDPIQVLSHLERVPFFGYGEARNGPLTLYSDVFYANLGLSGDGIRSRSLAPGINGTLSASLGLDFEETVVEVGGAYEVMKWDSHTAIDVLAGPATGTRKSASIWRWQEHSTWVTSIDQEALPWRGAVASTGSIRSWAHGSGII